MLLRKHDRYAAVPVAVVAALLALLAVLLMRRRRHREAAAKDTLVRPIESIHHRLNTVPDTLRAAQTPHLRSHAEITRCT